MIKCRCGYEARTVDQFHSHLVAERDKRWNHLDVRQRDAISKRPCAKAVGRNARILDFQSGGLVDSGA